MRGNLDGKAELLGPSEVSFELRISVSRIRQMMVKGQLPYVDTSLGRLVRRTDLDAYIAAQRGTEQRG